MSLAPGPLMRNHGGYRDRHAPDSIAPHREASLSLRPVLLGLLALAAVPACSVASAPDPLPTDGPSGPANNGNVGAEFPELTVEQNVDGSLHVSVTDPEAKAWRITLRGTADRADDGFEIVAEVGDVEPSVVIREIDGNAVVDEVNLTGMGREETAAAGGCHRSLPVCYASGDLALPGDGSATFGIDLGIVDPTVELEIVGASASWPGEPFVLGPWRETRSFRTPTG